ncbi:MAG: hypothetical protein LBE79_08330 [Tannerella sp.]|jgi:Spy/CpxP family protein refolding chaperone|nr:hypothetical protein [Tannerella sp.]
MKKILIVACLMTFVFTVSAQQGGQGGRFQQTPEQIAANLETMKKELNLNDKQFADFKKIDEDYQTKLQAARQNAGGGGFDREAMTKLREENTAKVKAILTADQFKKYETLQAQRMQRRPGN